ncbi:MAG: Haloacid dehalogenase domain protein hydrolase [Polaromonas sp.]|nr:Haloacid dehalogenase domain protein hydrolase [Polaromonas sp.]
MTSLLNDEGEAVVNRPVDWDGIDLVVFDVDGTLYDQRRLRLAMLRQLLADAWRSRSLATIQTLRTFRKVREALGDDPVDDFVQQQYAQTALRHGTTAEGVRALAGEWLEQRPLPFLEACRYPHLPELFAALRTAGKRIAVFSDYPATDKLAALGLHADPVVCATDLHIGRLKPDPLGLLAILRETGVAPERALMVGDREDRDAAAARQAGVRALIRSGQAHPGVETFRFYDDPVFQPLLARQAAAAVP